MAKSYYLVSVTNVADIYKVFLLRTYSGSYSVYSIYADYIRCSSTSVV